MSEHVEVIASEEGPLAYLVRASWRPLKSEFLTPDSTSLQMGMIVYGKGEVLPSHVHLPIVREVSGTNEMVLVREGDCELDIYTTNREHVARRHLSKGDLVLLLGGGHGFRMNEDTVLFEVKQGPFMGSIDKERF